MGGKTSKSKPNHQPISSIPNQRPLRYAPPTVPKITINTIKNVTLLNTHAYSVPVISTPEDYFGLIYHWQQRTYQHHARTAHEIIEIFKRQQSNPTLNPKLILDQDKIHYTRINPLVISPLGTQVHPCYTNEEVHLMSQYPPLDEEAWRSTLAQPTLYNTATQTLEHNALYQQIAPLFSKYDNQLDPITQAQGEIHPCISPITYTDQTNNTTYQLAHYRMVSHCTEDYGNILSQLNPLFGEHRRIIHEYESEQRELGQSVEEFEQYNAENYLPFDSSSHHTLCFSFQHAPFINADNSIKSDTPVPSWISSLITKQPTSTPFILFFVDVTCPESINHCHFILDQLIDFQRQGCAVPFDDQVPLVFILRNSTLLDSVLLTEADILSFCCDICHFQKVIFYHHDAPVSPQPAKTDLLYDPEDVKRRIQVLNNDNNANSFTFPLMQHFSSNLKLYNFLDELVLRLFCESNIEHLFTSNSDNDDSYRTSTKLNLTKYTVTKYVSRSGANRIISHAAYPCYGNSSDSQANYPYWPYHPLKQPRFLHFSQFVKPPRDLTPVQIFKAIKPQQSQDQNTILSSAPITTTTTPSTAPSTTTPSTTTATTSTQNATTLPVTSVPKHHNDQVESTPPNPGSPQNPHCLKTHGFVLYAKSGQINHESLFRLLNLPHTPRDFDHWEMPRAVSLSISRHILNSPSPSFQPLLDLFSPLSNSLSTTSTISTDKNSHLIPSTNICQSTSPCHFQHFTQISSKHISTIFFPQSTNLLDEFTLLVKKKLETDVGKHLISHFPPIQLPSTCLHLVAPIQFSSIHSNFLTPIQMTPFSSTLPVSIYTVQRHLEAQLIEQNYLATKKQSYEDDKLDSPIVHNPRYTAHPNTHLDLDLDTSPDHPKFETPDAIEYYYSTIEITPGYISHKSSPVGDSTRIASVHAQAANNTSFGCFIIDLKAQIEVSNKQSPLLQSDSELQQSILRSFQIDLSEFHYTPFTIWLLVIIPESLQSIQHIESRYPTLYTALMEYITAIQTPHPSSQRRNQHKSMLTVVPYFTTPSQTVSIWEYILRRSSIDRLHLINITNYIHDHPDQFVSITK